MPNWSLSDFGEAFSFIGSILPRLWAAARGIGGWRVGGKLAGRDLRLRPGFWMLGWDWSVRHVPVEMFIVR